MSARTFPRIKMGRAVTALLLLAVLSTATLVHLIWHRTATANVETVVASLDAQSTAAVRNELASNLALVSSSAEIVRSIFFQGAIKPDDEVKREFLFLSLLREQPAIAWIGFDQPNTLGRGEVGAKAALPVWMDYMKTALKGVPQQILPRPSGVVQVPINPDNGKLVTADFPGAILEVVQDDGKSVQDQAPEGAIY